MYPIKGIFYLNICLIYDHAHQNVKAGNCVIISTNYIEHIDSCIEKELGKKESVQIFFLKIQKINLNFLSNNCKNKYQSAILLNNSGHLVLLLRK